APPGTDFRQAGLQDSGGLDVVYAAKIALARRIRDQQRGGLAGRAAHAAAEAKLPGIQHAAAPLDDRFSPAGFRQKPPRIVLGAADRSPNKGYAQARQVARLAIAAEIHLVDEVEADFTM